jgi:hypothetical protein
MQIDSLSISMGPSIYYDDKFRNVLESFMSFLRNDSSTSVIAIDPAVSYKYEFDLYGLLAAEGIPTYMQWVVMRMNRIDSPNDAGNNILGLLVPDAGVLEHIRQSYMSTTRI